MHRPLRPLLLFAFVALLLPASGASADQAKARRKLDDEYIPFTAEKFHHYVFMGERKMVGLFLEAGMPVDTKDKDGRTALHRAAESDDPKLMEMLLKAGANVNARDEKGTTPLCRAASSGNAKNAQALLAKGADVNAVCGWGKTALHEAAEKEDASVVNLLLKAGAKVEARDEHSETPLAFALNTEKLDTMRALLAAGADPNVKWSQGETPLHAAIDHRKLEAIRALLAAGAAVDGRNGNGQTPLWRAANLDYVEAIPVLLAAGADPEAKDNSRESVRQIAKRARSARAIDALKDAKKVAVAQAGPVKTSAQPIARKVETKAVADPKAELARQGLAFDADTFWKRLEAEDERAVALFLKAGFDSATRNEMGRPPLYVAVEEHAAMVPVLLEAGANVNDPGKSTNPMTESGDSLVLRAVSSGNADVLGALLARKSDPNRPNKYGATPLQEAVMAGRADLVGMLLKGGAKVGKQRQTLLQIAKDPAVKKLIKEAV